MAEAISAGLKQAVKCIQNVPVRGISTYGIIDSGGHIIYETVGAGCHQSVDMHTGPMRVIYTCHVKNEFEDFYRWLYSPDGPYTDIIGTDERIVDGVDIHSIDFRLKYGLVIENIEVPTNFLFSLFSASRVGWEHPDSMMTWAALVKAGIHPKAAFFFCGLVYKSTHQYLFGLRGNANHWPFLYSFTNPELYEKYLKNYMAGVIARPTGLFSMGCRDRSPMSGIWGENGRSSQYNPPYVLMDLAQADAGSVSGTWVSQSVRSITFDKLVDFINSELKRLNLA